MTHTALMQPAFSRIINVVPDYDGVVTLEIEAPDAENTSPGQFTMLYAFGVGEIPISISRITARGTYLHTIRDVGAVSKALVQCEPGASIGMRGPFGTGWPVDEVKGKDVVLIAGGLGLAPVRPVIDHILAHRSDYGTFRILYGTRSPETILFGPELDKWHTADRTKVKTTVDFAGTHWNGRVGPITPLLSLTSVADDAVYMMCGPEVMMRVAARTLLNNGVGEDQLYLSMERNMKCALGLCGRCQLGPAFICRDGPVFRYDRIRSLLSVREL